MTAVVMQRRSIKGPPPPRGCPTVASVVHRSFRRRRRHSEAEESANQTRTMVLLSSEGVPVPAAKDQHQQKQRIEINPHGDSLYVVGVPCGEGARSCAERFDASTREWHGLSAPRTTRRWAGICALGGSLYCVGGFDGIAHLNTVDRYVAASDSWLSDVAPISGPRAHVAGDVTRGAPVRSGR
ncbi:kelch-like protein 12 isoform X1 [Petromyzon marinus]|uniref:kelch-like protein 12 isoform X1 n=2 Tax=Petromyzon marinus TaxID=7757 RepID=UPI003F70DF22